MYICKSFDFFYVGYCRQSQVKRSKQPNDEFKNARYEPSVLSLSLSIYIYIGGKTVASLVIA
jgi:hypothetical protein